MLEEKRLILKRMYLAPKVKQLPWEREYGRAIVDEAEYRKHPADDRFARGGLMNCLINQARYDEAYEIAVELGNEQAKTVIERLRLAEERDDADWCDCQAKSAKHQNCLHRNDQTAACSCSACPFFTGKIWSNRKQTWADVWVCPNCSFTNFR